MGHCKVLDHGGLIHVTTRLLVTPQVLIGWPALAHVLEALILYIKISIHSHQVRAHRHEGTSGDQSRGTAFPLPTCPSVLATGC